MQVLKSSCLQIGFFVSGVKARTNIFCVKPGQPSKLSIQRQPPAVVISGVVVIPGPLMVIQDDWDNIATDTCVLIISIISNISLVSNQTGTASGLFNFTNLIIYAAGSGYHLSFGLEGSSYPVRSRSFDVVPNNVNSAVITRQPGVIWEGRRIVVAGKSFRVEVSLFDAYGNKILCCCSAAMSKTYQECVANVAPAFKFFPNVDLGSSLLHAANTTLNGVMTWSFALSRAQMEINLKFVCDNSSVLCPFQNYLEATTMTFDVIHDSQSKLSISGTEQNPIYLMAGGIPASNLTAGKGAYFQVQIEDQYGNPIKNSTQTVPYLEFSEQSMGFTQRFTHSNPGANLLVKWAGNGCFQSSLGGLLQCKSPTTCVGVTSVPVPVPGSIIGTDCAPFNMAASLSDGISRISFYINSAGIAKLSVCVDLGTGILPSPLCSMAVKNTSSDLEPSCKLLLPYCSLFANTNSFAVLPDTISSVKVRFCSAGYQTPLPIGGLLRCEFALVDQYGNSVFGEGGSKEILIEAVYSGSSILGMQSKTNAAYGIFNITIPEDSQNFSSPFKVVKNSQQVTYKLTISSLVLTSYSYFFNIIHGPVEKVLFRSVISNTPVNSLIRMLDSNSSNIALVMEDRLGNLDDSNNQIYPCIIQGLVLISTQGWSLQNGSWNGNITSRYGIINLPPMLTESKTRNRTAIYVTISALSGRTFDLVSQEFQIVSGYPSYLKVISSPMSSVSNEIVLGSVAVSVMDANENFYSCKIPVSAHLEKCSNTNSMECLYPEVSDLFSLVGTTISMYDPTSMFANFTNVYTRAVGAAKVRIKFSLCADTTYSGIACLDFAAVPLVVCNKSDEKVVSNVSRPFDVSVVKQLVLVSQIGTNDNRDLQISLLPRVLSGETLGILKVKLVDSNGNVTNNSAARVLVSINGSPMSISLLGLTESIANEGLAIFAGLSIGGSGAGITLRFVLDTDPTVAVLSHPFNVESSDAIHPKISVQPPHMISAGFQFDVVLILRNFYMRQIGDALTHFAIARIWDSSTPLQGPTTNNFPGMISCQAKNGTAVFSGLRVIAAGNYRLAFYVPSSSGYLEGPDTVLSDIFTVAHGTPSRLVVLSQPGSMGVSMPMSVQPVLQLADEFLNYIKDPVISNVTIVAASLSGPTGSALGGTLLVMGIEGLITFTDLAVQGPTPVSEDYRLAFHLYVDNVLAQDSLESEVFAVRAVSKFVFQSRPSTSFSQGEIVGIHAAVMIEDAVGRIVPSDYEILVISSQILFRGKRNSTSKLGIALFDDLEEIGRAHV